MVMGCVLDRLGSGQFGTPGDNTALPFPRRVLVSQPELRKESIYPGSQGGPCGRGKSRSSWLVTQRWGPHPQCETLYMYRPHLMGGGGRFSEPAGKVPGKQQVLNNVLFFCCQGEASLCPSFRRRVTPVQRAE